MQIIIKQLSIFVDTKLLKTMEILKKVQQFIETNRLFQENERVLVGVSGGADSVVLLNILLKMGYKCVVAHCNFHLRGEESNRDEKFVENLTKEYNLLYKKIDFDTVGYAKSNKISIEMAARDLRYSWFEKMAAETKCTSIAVAHHADDSIETVLLNMIRGTGLKGLTGIEPRNGKVVRPLLCCNRDEVEDYAEKYKIHFVTDSTNAANDYSRNKIRNVLLPLMAEINPSIKQTMVDNADRLRGAWKIYTDKIREIENEITIHEDGNYLIDIEKLRNKTDVKTVLFELLQPFHFHPDVISDIYENLDKRSGGRFYSDSHRLLKDRSFLIIDEIDKTSQIEFTIAENASEIDFPIHLTLTNFKRNDNFQPSILPHTIHVDGDKIKFPLTLRKWKDGDSFYPFGMAKSKKLSNFFIDEKLNRNQKEDIWILLSDDKIVWLVGLRLDNRFRVKDSTSNILEIKWEG